MTGKKRKYYGPSQTTETTGRITEELVRTSISSAPSGCDHWFVAETRVPGQTTESATTPALTFSKQKYRHYFNLLCPRPFVATLI